MRYILENQVLIISSIARVITRFFVVLLPILAFPIAHDLGISFGEVISLSTLSIVLFGVGSLPAGWFADRWSTEGMMTIFFIGLGFAAVMVALAQTPLELMITLGLGGLFCSISGPVSAAWILKTARNKGKALGMNSWVGNIGSASAALIAGLLIQAFSWRAAFMIPGIISIAIGIFLLVSTRGKILTQKLKKQPRRQVKAQPSRGNYRPLAILTALVIGSGLIYQALTTIFPNVMLAKAQVDPTQLDLMSCFWIGLTYFIAGSAHLIGGHLADRYSPKVVYGAFYVLLIPLLFLATSLTSTPLWIMMTMGLFLNLGASPAEKIMIAEFAPEGRKATALGTRFSIGVGFGALGAPLVGFIHDLSGGFFWVLIVTAVLAGITAAISFLLPSKEAAKAPSLEPELVARF